MVSNKKIERANLCRECLSECMRVNLEREDCRYFPYMSTCHKCKRNKHIVTGVKPFKRIFASNDW